MTSIQRMPQRNSSFPVRHILDSNEVNHYYYDGTVTRHRRTAKRIYQKLKHNNVSLGSVEKKNVAQNPRKSIRSRLTSFQRLSYNSPSDATLCNSRKKIKELDLYRQLFRVAGIPREKIKKSEGHPFNVLEVATNLNSNASVNTLHKLCKFYKLKEISGIIVSNNFPTENFTIQGRDYKGNAVYRTITHNVQNDVIRSSRDIPLENTLRANSPTCRSKYLISLKDRYGRDSILYRFKETSHKDESLFKQYAGMVDHAITTAQKERINGATLISNSIALPVQIAPLNTRNLFSKKQLTKNKQLTKIYMPRMTGKSTTEFASELKKEINFNDPSQRKKFYEFVQLWGRDTLASARCMETMGFCMTDLKFSNSIVVEDSKGNLRIAQIDVDDLVPLENSHMVWTYGHPEICPTKNSTNTFSMPEKRLLCRARALLISMLKATMTNKQEVDSMLSFLRDTVAGMDSPNADTNLEILSSNCLTFFKEFGLPDKYHNILINLLLQPKSLLFQEALTSPLNPQVIANIQTTSKNPENLRQLHTNFEILEEALNELTNFKEYQEPDMSKSPNLLIK